MSAIAYSTGSTLGSHIAGLAEWWKAMLITGIGFLLFYMRGHAPDYLSIYLGNILILGMAGLSVIAHVKFFNIPVPKKTICFLIGSGVTGVTLSFFLSSNSAFLVLSTSLPVAIILVMIIDIVARHTQWRTQRSTWATLGAMALMSAALFIRSGKAIFTDGSGIGLLSKSGTQFGFLVAGALCIMGMSMGFILMVHEKHRKDILESSKRDGLTGLYHRAAFFDLADATEVNDDTTYSLLMVDIDHFKSVNDTYGHAAGDIAITHVSRLIANTIRNTDLAGRYGGEEFCIMLKGCKQEDAAKFANRLVEETGKQRIRLPEGREISVTISAGFASRPITRRKDDKQPTVKDILEQADQALLMAKRTGRNKAVSA